MFHIKYSGFHSPACVHILPVRKHDETLGENMPARRSMTMFYISISIAILSSALYHFSQKATPKGVNPAVTLLVTYVVAILLTLILLHFIPVKNGILAELRQVNWASILLAFSIVGLEVGFLLVYRSGWNIGLAAVLVNVVASLLLVPVALLVFRDRLNWINIAGILTCLAGLVMLNWKR
jgi:drug/metabolite transporter (DMT)-like permease